MTDQEESEATLRCTRCGHSVPPPAESTSDEILIVCPACGANLGSWGDAKKEIGKTL
jgi:DNA-directed RNA polymerase subunit RPC12/RpoP